VLVSGEEDSGNPREADIWQVIFCKVAENDLSVRVLRLPCCDKVPAKRTRDGVTTTRAGLDVEQCRHMIPFVGSLHRTDEIVNLVDYMIQAIRERFK
jgi:hypothetical protein